MADTDISIQLESELAELRETLAFDRDRWNECAHDAVEQRERAEKAEAERDELRRRIDEAPMTDVMPFGTVYEIGLPRAWVGKRVRLVVDDE